MPCLTPYRGDTSQMLLFKIASCLEASGDGVGVTSFNGFTGPVTGVTSFNGRDGVVTLLLSDVSSVADGRYVLKAGDTMTGALVHPDGTAALPSITFTGDLDTGVYHPAANTIGLTAGGSLILSVSPTGINLTNALAYQYNSVNVIRAITGIDNYFFGPNGNLTSTGVNNIAVGSGILLSNTTGASNAAVGVFALLSNIDGTGNMAFGMSALRNNTSGSSNVGIGSDSLRANTTGAINVAVGADVLRANISGSGNVGVGSAALVNSTGGDNTALGTSSFPNLTTGSDNTGVGNSTGAGITTGSNNTILGANVTGLAAALTNNIIIADGSGNQRITVGSTGIVTIPIALTLSTAAPLSMASGANQRAGDVVLVAGTVTTANTTVTANTRVYTSRRTAGGVLGNLTYTIIAATSFTITSDNISDTSTVSYLLIEVP